MKRVFSRHYIVDHEKDINEYRDLEQELVNARRLQDELYRPFETQEAKLKLNRSNTDIEAAETRGGFLRILPNFHQVHHIRSNAEYYGTNLNSTTSIGELIHMLWKNLVPHTNYKELDKTFCKCVSPFLWRFATMCYDPTNIRLIRYWVLMDTLRLIVDMEEKAAHPWVPVLKRLRKDVPKLLGSGYFFGRIVRVSEEGSFAKNRRGLASKLSLVEGEFIYSYVL